MMKIPKAFTLIELLIVVAIIGVLAAIAVPNFLNAQIRAKIGRVQSEFKTISTAFEMYRLDGGGRLPDAWTIGGWYKAWSCFTTPVAYLSTVPIDIFQPKEKSNFVNQHNYYEFVESYKDDPKKAKDYAIASLGPDREDDTLNLAAYPNSSKFVPYSTSNGLVSDGDVLYETKPGLNPMRW
ncbi:MAG: prepilin-type N-terminal cleavage/methylation domain-containing protein [Candidatus Omnitrophota bacterium]